MSTTKMGHNNCPVCEKFLDLATSVEEDQVPMPGDITICIGCAAALRFADDMALYKPELKELATVCDIAKLQQIGKVQAAILSLKSTT